MARYPKGSPQEGGYYALWAKQWLDDDKLKSISKELKCCFSEVMACAQLIDFVTGRLERGGFIQSKEAICKRAGISVAQLNELLKHGLIGEDKTGCVFITNWWKWQSPEAKKSKYNAQGEQHNNSGLNPELNPDLNGGVKASNSFHQHQQTNGSSKESTSKATPKPSKKTYMAQMKEQWEKEKAPKQPIDIDF